MSAQANCFLVRRLIEEVWNENNIEVAKDIIHADYRSNEGITFESESGINRLTKEMEFYRKTYPGLKFAIDFLKADGDTVTSGWRATGSSRETFTNRKGDEELLRLDSRGMGLSRILEGKIVENTFYWSRQPLHP